MEKYDMDNYDIEKLAETNNRERKMSHDFDDENDLGMDFFKTMEEIYSQINKKEFTNENENSTQITNF